MSIKTRLFMAGALTIASVMAYSFWSNRHQNRLGNILLLNQNIAAINSAAELKHAFVFYDDLILRFMLTGDDGLVDEARRYQTIAQARIIEIKKNSQSATIGQFLEDLDKESQLYFEDAEKMIQFHQRAKFPEGRPIEAIAVWGKQFPQYQQSVNLMSSTGRQRLTRIYSICEKLLDINRVELENAKIKVDQLLQEGNRAAWWAALLIFGATALVTVILALSILKPLNILMAGVKKMVNGDLGVEMPITSADEMGTLTQAFNSMTRTLREKQDQLLQETITDALMGIYNFRYFQEVIRRELDRARRYERPLSIVIADIDHFKQFNDTHGHEMGNVILKKAAQALRETLRNEDTLARYGGEEFVALLADTNKEQAQATAERLREAIAATPFPGGQKQPLGKITVSIGIASYPADGQTSQALIERADRALYKAKEQGRNRVVWV